MRWILILTLFSVVAFAGRMLAPSDLYDNEQPKTITYTVDVLQHGRYLLPFDTYGRPPRKPPLYNWIGAAIVGVSGLYTEPILKAPSILAGLATIPLVVWFAMYLIRRPDATDDPELAASDRLPPDVPLIAFGAIAAALWLASHMGLKLIYLARPDMLLVMFLIGAWACATLLLDGARRGWRWALPLWLCVAGAALCKGPPALLPVIFILLAARLCQGRWSAMRQTGILWGLPLAIVLVGAWLGAAYLVDPVAVEEELIRSQAVGKVTDRGLERIFTEIYKSPGFFVVRFLPWSIIALLAYLHVPWRQWGRHRMGPAYIWILLVIGFFALASEKRGDYLAPAMPAAAILATYWLLVVGRKYALRPANVMGIATAVLAGLLVYQFTLSPAARSELGVNVKQFVQQVETVVGDAPVIFEHIGYNPIQPLMGMNQAGPPTEAEREAAVFVIAPLDENAPPPLIRSELIPHVFAGKPARLGLYRAADWPGRGVTADAAP